MKIIRTNKFRLVPEPEFHKLELTNAKTEKDINNSGREEKTVPKYGPRNKIYSIDGEVRNSYL
jgi:hypothetical protein